LCLIGCQREAARDDLSPKSQTDSFISPGKVASENAAPLPTGVLVCRAHEDAVVSIRFSLDAKTIQSVSQDGTICFWQTATGKALRQDKLKDGRNRNSSFALSPQGKNSVTAERYGGGIRLWDVVTGKVVRDFASRQREVTSTAFSADSTILAVGGGKPYRSGVNPIDLWNIQTGEKLQELNVAKGEIVSLGFSPDGKMIAVASNYDNLGWDRVSEISLWDLRSGKAIWKRPVPKGSIHSLAFSPNSKILATGDRDATIRLWDANSGKQLSEFGGQRAFLSWAFLSCPLIFSTDGKTIAVGSQSDERRNGTVQLWEVASGTIRWESSGLQGAITSLAFSPDRRLLASGSMDTTVLLWDLWRDLGYGLQSRDISAKELEELWSDLAASNAQDAFQTIKKLVGAKQSVAFLKQHLRAVPQKPVSTEQVGRWIRELDDDEFETRENATRELEQIGKAAKAALLEKIKKMPSPEVRRRVEELLDKMDSSQPGLEMVRPVRALEVLEYIGTPEAQEVLNELSEGKTEAVLTQEAKAALSRLIHQSPALDN
jgi:WD40 repeat protein